MLWYYSIKMNNVCWIKKNKSDGRGGGNGSTNSFSKKIYIKNRSSSVKYLKIYSMRQIYSHINE